jgi:hypothetical protein
MNGLGRQHIRSAILYRSTAQDTHTVGGDIQRSTLVHYYVLIARVHALPPIAAPAATTTQHCMRLAIHYFPRWDSRFYTRTLTYAHATLLFEQSVTLVIPHQKQQQKQQQEHRTSSVLPAAPALTWATIRRIMCQTQRQARRDCAMMVSSPDESFLPLQQYHYTSSCLLHILFANNSPSPSDNIPAHARAI